ncbi:MAG: sulfurtransferase, partial [Pedobacter sp.]
MKISPIIEAKALSEILEDANVMIFDVSNGKNALTNYKAQHITGAIFIDLNSRLAQIKEDFSNGGSHPLPTVESFAETLTALGISKGTHVVIYDGKNGSNAAARFWWMLRSTGHENV